MKKRQLGKSDLYVSEISLGGMSLGDGLDEAKRIIDYAIDHGINFIDTADLYDQGANEELIGSIIKEKRKNLIIATKGGNQFEIGKEGWTWNPTKKHLIQAAKESVRRLQIDHIDLYQLHGGTIDDSVDDVIDAFEQLKKEGVIRYYGISSIRPNVIHEYATKTKIETIMMQYSLFDRRPESLLSLLEMNKKNVLVRGALAKGRLTNDKRNQDNSYLTYMPEEIEAFQSAFTAAFPSRSLHSAALHYCLSSPIVSSLVIGASRQDQLEQTMAAYHTNRLTDDERMLLQSITKANEYDQHLP